MTFFIPHIFWLQLSEALAVLTDAEARKAYDNVLKARQAVQIRNQQLDAKRAKLKEDLEERERAANERNLVYRQKTDEEKLEKEIERLRKEGKRQLEEEEERIRKLIEEEKLKSAAPVANVSGPAKIKVRWSGGSYDKVGSDLILFLVAIIGLFLFSFL